MNSKLKDDVSRGTGHGEVREGANTEAVHALPGVGAADERSCALPRDIRRAEEQAMRAARAREAAAELTRARAIAHLVACGQRSAVGTPEARTRRRDANSSAVGPLLGPLSPRIESQAARQLSRPTSQGTGGTAWWLAPIIRRAEAQATKWARGNQARTAATKEEIGGASGADDMGAFYVRVFQEAAAIYREAALTVACGMLSTLRARGVRVNRAARKAIARHAARWGCVKGRKAAEAWEYAAIRNRDGREVGGGWALQGAIHGLLDFSLSAEEFTESESHSESEGTESADPDEVAGGVLKSRPDSGEGSGMRPSVAASLESWASGVRESFAERVRAASTTQARCAAKAAADSSLTLIEGLANFARGRASGLDPAIIAEFFDESGAVSATGRKRISRLRARTA